MVVSKIKPPWTSSKELKEWLSEDDESGKSFRCHGVGREEAWGLFCWELEGLVVITALPRADSMMADSRFTWDMPGTDDELEVAR